MSMFNARGSTAGGQPGLAMPQQTNPIDRRAAQMMQTPQQPGTQGMPAQPGPIQTPTQMPQPIPMGDHINALTTAISRRLHDIHVATRGLHMF